MLLSDEHSTRTEALAASPVLCGCALLILRARFHSLAFLRLQKAAWLVLMKSCLASLVLVKASLASPAKLVVLIPHIVKI
jgi:hypothetical protein